MHTRGFASALALLGFLASPLEAQKVPSYALKGTLVAPHEIIEGGAILVRGEKIEGVGKNLSSASSSVVIETDSFIFPGLIDLHDHLTWNLFPRWNPGSLFPNRYEWQQLALYNLGLATPHQELFDQGLGCEMDLYAEVKAILGGATSVVGSLGPSKPGLEDNRCIEGLARNLDFYSGLNPRNALNAEKLRYEVFPFQLSVQDAELVRSGLDHGQLKAFLIHVAEGKPNDASSAREFRFLKARGFLRPGVSVIHGVALGRAEFHEMAGNGVGLIWSPRSNIELYGATAGVAGAKQEGVRIALAPDWSPTGSNGMLEELKFAATWNEGQSPRVFDEAELFKMATLCPAQLAGLSDQLGALEPQLQADLLVIKRRHLDAYQALLHAVPEDVKLVVIGGAPIYGDPQWMRRLLPGEPLELIEVCGEEKALAFGHHTLSGGKSLNSWKETYGRLAAALRDWGIALAPLADCHN